MTIQELNIILKNIIIELTQRESFVHHKWYAQYHLLVVEKLCTELVRYYPEANTNQVTSLLWIHDYCKIAGVQTESDYRSVYQFLLSIGFDQDYANNIRKLLVIFESKMEFDLHQAPIEVQIVSSCDAFSHYTWPFEDIFARENPQKSIDEIRQSRLKKIQKDRERKITLAQVKQALEKRKDLYLEYFCGQAKESYFTTHE